MILLMLLMLKQLDPERKEKLKLKLWNNDPNKNQLTAQPKAAAWK